MMGALGVLEVVVFREFSVEGVVQGCGQVVSEGGQLVLVASISRRRFL